MARKKTGAGEELLTLTEVRERTGISMPSLLRYKKEHQDRIPSVGKGRTQRYPVAALEVFEEIKRENLSKRGRPKGSGGGAKKAGRPAKAGRKGAGGGGRGRSGRAAAAAGEGDGEELLTLTQVAAQTGISYPTLRNYAERHGDRIPSVGEGRKRRYRPEAVAVFQELRAESRPGRKPKGGGAAAGRGKSGGGAAAGGGKRAGAGAAGGGRVAAKAAGDGDGSGELGRRVADLAGRQERLRRDLEKIAGILRRPTEATLRWR